MRRFFFLVLGESWIFSLVLVLIVMMGGSYGHLPGSWEDDHYHVKVDEGTGLVFLYTILKPSGKNVNIPANP